MLIGTKSKHAVIAMINLARLNHSTEALIPDAHTGRTLPNTTISVTISLATLANCQDASVSYLEQIFADLRKAELVISTRGPGGGYVVASLDITVAQIVNAIHEQPAEESTGWKAVERRVGESLNITLRDLLV
jgi:Rrf2 family iron-sulfur cluster assembly transcriptional regulator